MKKELKGLGLTKDDGKLVKGLTVEPVSHGYKLIDISIAEIMKSTNSTGYKIYLTSNDKSNYRFDVATIQTYKGNRTAGKPAHYDALREYLVGEWGAIMIEGKEADDEMATEQYQSEVDTIICTQDKDLDMIPGMHYNFITKNLYETSDPGHLKLVKNNKKLEGGGLLWFYAQCLLGDSADNIPGIQKCGPVMAHKTLSHIRDEEIMIRTVYTVYLSKFSPREALSRFKEVADLLWMQREVDERKSKHIEEVLNG